MNIDRIDGDCRMTNMVTDRKDQLVLYVVMAMAFFLDGLDGTIVTVALPEIGKSFAMSTSDSSWVVTVYFMMMAGLILVFGKIADKGAIKKVLVGGFIIFALGSLLCALSYNSTFLLISRAIQGIGSAMLASTGIMLAVKFFPPKMMIFAMTLSVLGSSVGAAFGPTLGGILTNALSWHWIFIINVPIGVICAVFAHRYVPSDDKMDDMRFDYLGSLLLFLSLICGLYAVESIPSHGIGVTNISALVAFVIIFAIFVTYDLKKEDPVLDLRLFKISRFDRAILAFMILNASYMGCLYLIPFMLSIEVGYDTMECGLIMLTQALVTLVLCLPVAKACSSRGTRTFAIIGCSLMMLTCIIFTFLDSSTGLISLIFGLILLGSVWGFSGSSVGTRLVENVPSEKKGSASSLLSFFVYFGSALGTAMFSAFFNIGSNSSGISISDLPSEIFMEGFRFTMIVASILAFCAVLLSASIRSRTNE